MSFRSDARRFYGENSASFVQAELYGLFESQGLKDRAVLQALLHTRFSRPGLSLHTQDVSRPYAALWSKYMVDSRGGDPTILPRVYERLGPGGDLFSVLDQVLAETGGGLEIDYQTYAEWNYRIGPYADGTGYVGAEAFETIWGSVPMTAEHGPAPVAGGERFDSGPAGLGTHYVRFGADPASEDGLVRFTGQFGTRWGVSVLARDPSTGVYEVRRAFVGPLRTEAELEIPRWNESDDRVLVVSNLSVPEEADTARALYRYSISAADPG